MNTFLWQLVNTLNQGKITDYEPFLKRDSGLLSGDTLLWVALFLCWGILFGYLFWLHRKLVKLEKRNGRRGE